RMSFPSAGGCTSRASASGAPRTPAAPSRARSSTSISTARKRPNVSAPKRDTPSMSSVRSSRRRTDRNDAGERGTYGFAAAGGGAVFRGRTSRAAEGRGFANLAAGCRKRLSLAREPASAIMGSDGKDDAHGPGNDRPGSDSRGRQGGHGRGSTGGRRR